MTKILIKIISIRASKVKSLFLQILLLYNTLRDIGNIKLLTIVDRFNFDKDFLSVGHLVYKGYVWRVVYLGPGQLITVSRGVAQTEVISA